MEEWSTPKGFNLKAFMNDTYEHQVEEEDEVVLEPDFAAKIEEETFMLLDGPENRIVSTDEIPEEINLVTETETEEMKIILDVTVISYFKVY